jgi:hypothetical protein
MTTDKEIIAKLVKIAEKQQKIINKLAQMPPAPPPTTPTPAPAPPAADPLSSGSDDANTRAANVLKSNYKKVLNLNVQNVKVSDMDKSSPQVEVVADGAGATAQNVNRMSIEYFLFQMKRPTITLNGNVIMQAGRAVTV